MGSAGCCSDFLFARPSFVRGMARTFDLFGAFTIYNISLTGAEADRRAITCDWDMTLADFRAAYERAVQQAGAQRVHQAVIEEDRPGRASAR
jgi:hypothetical protein